MTKDGKEKRRSRRGRGEGSIYQRGDGKWTASITVGINANGRRVRKVVYGATKKEVQDKLTSLQGQKLDGMLIDSSKQTLAEFLTRWLEDVARLKLRASTFENYRAIVENHVSPKIGGLRLERVSAEHIQGLYSAMERGGASAYVRRLAHAVLRKALSQALRWRKIGQNPCLAVDPPSIPDTEINPLNGEQVAKLLSAAEGDRLEALYIVAVTAGLRLGEIFGLQWGDIDLETGSLSVRRTLSEVKGNLTLTEPKTSKSRRRVDLPAIAVDALTAHRKKMMREGFIGSHVFCNQSGGLLRRSHFHAQHYKPLLTKAGLPSIRFHDLRHTSATLLLLGGAHPKVVQERLGHSQISVTMDIYSHVLPGMQREAASALDSMLKADKAKLKAAQKTAKRSAKRKAAAG